MFSTMEIQKAAEYFAAKLEFTTGPVELAAMMQQDTDINIIDVRHEEDFHEGHIPGAVNLPPARWPTLENVSKDKTNIVYCYSQQCHLAAKACKLFAEHGCPVMELEGGFKEWRRHSFPIDGVHRHHHNLAHGHKHKHWHKHEHNDEQ